MSPLMLIVIVVLALLLMGGSVLLLRRSEDDPLAVRIDEFAAREEIVSIEEIELSLPFSDRVFVPIISRIIEFLVHYTP